MARAQKSCIKLRTSKKILYFELVYHSIMSLSNSIKLRRAKSSLQMLPGNEKSKPNIQTRGTEYEDLKGQKDFKPSLFSNALNFAKNSYVKHSLTSKIMNLPYFIRM